MKIDEIELVNIGQSFPKDHVQQFLDGSSPNGRLDDFVVNYRESGNHRGIILTDSQGDIAAYVGFVVRLNGRVWQAKNAVVYEPYKGQGLVGRVYRMVKQHMGQSIQSDTEQTTDGMRLWTRTLPSLGLHPMIYDAETGHVLSPEQGQHLIYPQSGSGNQHRYTWILERHDHYPEQNLLLEESLLMPLKNLWYQGDYTQ
jgi:hypothetical protein